MADHGEAFGEHGHNMHASSLYDEQVRVPLAVRVPGLAPRRVAGTASIVDIVPTTLGLVGLTAPASLDGADLRPQMAGAPDLGRAFGLFGDRVMIVEDHEACVRSRRRRVRVV
jgi:arylsulfatase A-like enzyme